MHKTRLNLRFWNKYSLRFSIIIIDDWIIFSRLKIDVNTKMYWHRRYLNVGVCESENVKSTLHFLTSGQKRSTSSKYYLLKDNLKSVSYAIQKGYPE